MNKEAQAKLKPHKCSKCTSTFATSTNLRAHFRTVHLKIRAKCPDCEKDFYDQGAVRRHRISEACAGLPEHKWTVPTTRKNGRPGFKCAACPKICKKQAVAQHHYEISHIPKRCTKCKQNLVSLRALKQHLLEKHPQNVVKAVGQKKDQKKEESSAKAVGGPGPAQHENNGFDKQGQQPIVQENWGSPGLNQVFWNMNQELAKQAAERQRANDEMVTSFLYLGRY